MRKIELDDLINVNQGDDNEFNFKISKLNAKEIYRNAEVIRLSELDVRKNAIQRFLNESRANDIATYCETKNAIFPTPIILSLNSDFIIETLRKKIIVNTSDDIISELGQPFSIIDGQHRLEGINRYHQRGGEKDFQMPVVVYLDADQVTSASIFVTINSNQKTVDQSTIHQLFGIIYNSDINLKNNIYTVQSFSSNVIQALNKTPNSPFFESIRMLGKKETSKQFISLGTMAKKITERITSNAMNDNLLIEQGQRLNDNPDKIFREFFIDNDEYTVSKVLMNFFNAFSTNFNEIWSQDSNYITKKAVGFSALMRLFDHVYKKLEDLSENNLIYIFKKMKEKDDISKTDSKRNLSEIEILFGSSASSESVAKNISVELIRKFDEVVCL